MSICLCHFMPFGRLLLQHGICAFSFFTTHTRIFLQTSTSVCTTTEAATAEGSASTCRALEYVAGVNLGGSTMEIRAAEVRCIYMKYLLLCARYVIDMFS